MDYYANADTGKLEQHCTRPLLKSGYPKVAPPSEVRLIRLPNDYQDVFFEAISGVLFDDSFIIAHPKLQTKQIKIAALNWDRGYWYPVDHKIFNEYLQSKPTKKVFGPDVVILPKVICDQLAASPLHYGKGSIQPWDFITSQGMNFLEGNIIKYVTRYKHKNGVADLKKAQTYLNKLISEVEKCHE